MIISPMKARNPANQGVLQAGGWMAVLLMVGWLTGCSPSPPQHGTALVLAIDTNRLGQVSDASQPVVQAQEVLRQRLKRLGIRGFIERNGPGQLTVRLPRLGSNDLAAARRAITWTSILEFRMVHPESDELVREKIIEPGYELLTESRRLPDGRSEALTYLVSKKPEQGLTSRYIQRAWVERDPISGEPQITFELNSEGARIFSDITTEYAPKGGKYHQLAIVMDGELYSAPRINGPITGGRGLITGDFSLREAFNLANVLENPLDLPFRLVEEKAF
jgi:protein-export membrane protein SecD